MTNKATKVLKEAEHLLTYTRSTERDLILRLSQELEASLEGLYGVYVSLGFDTDGARNARELFGPWVGFDPATHIPELAAEYRRESEEDYDNDLAKAWYEGHRKGIRWSRGDTTINPYRR